MAYIRATYNSGSVTSVEDSSQLATGQEIYWQDQIGRLLEDENGEPYEIIENVTPEGISDTLGMWDNINNNFIPDGFYDKTTGWIWPSGSIPNNNDINEWKK